ncbi:hypothetical protein [Paracoccus sp. TOH]|uniref:hypothetical protein n=1 Tax=Paracoccus sp. TOH TaxID=1263728 RepID=UPI0025B116CC|nr:hypothetical protein [Paracoccus sp. TOH]WJS86323.1 hypothetical protein NBE95_13185 [Paracoccus sp. TOH]
MLRNIIDDAKSKNPDVNILLSIEEIAASVMSTITLDTIAALRDFIHRWGKDVRLLVYVRKPEDYYLSMTQEKLKRSGGVIPPHEFRTNFSEIIQIYEDVFGTNATVRPFESGQWRNGDLLADFLDQIKDIADVDPKILYTDVLHSNETLSGETMFALDLMRRFPDNMAQSSAYTFMQSERLWRKFRDIAEKAGYTRKPRLFESVAATVAAVNQDDSRALFERHGIEFYKCSKFSPGEPLPESERLSDVESLVPVNRDQALRIISVLCAGDNAFRAKKT